MPLLLPPLPFLCFFVLSHHPRFIALMSFLDFKNSRISKRFFLLNDDSFPVWEWIEKRWKCDEIEFSYPQLVSSFLRRFAFNYNRSSLKSRILSVIDINECELRNPCARNQKCSNTNGGYRCITSLNCQVGFELNADGNQCVDIDECEKSEAVCGPQQTCKNKPGGYTCMYIQLPTLVMHSPFV